MLHFPPELLHQVITLTLGQYLSDVLLAPESTRSWDAIGTLLHVNHCFRCCTLRVLSPLWDGTFVERKSGYPCNYKPSIEYLRSLAELAKSDPRGILPACDVPSMRKITVPYERLGRSFAFHMARANACALHQPEMPLPWDMSDFAQGYTALPRELRECMFGRVADYAVQNLLVWMRVVVFEELVTNTEKLLFFIDPVTFSIVRLCTPRGDKSSSVALLYTG
ncbi:hypothetical protein BC834DRAFT_903266 [Gloeopeniophorella convolvens]|nr:hypothetical protein BC834DRAFT_903266 [Gloeopeniophorella convolvens]